MQGFRVRTAVVAALLVIGTLAAPAGAGQGVSMWCNDGASLGGTYVHIIDDPVTLNAEVGGPPGAFIELCYSTTPRGNGDAAVTGGRIFVTESGVECTDDSSPVVLRVDCDVPADPDPSRTGGVAVVTLQVQHLVVGGPVGVEAGPVGSPLCLRDVTVYTPATTIGPFNLGACP